MVIVCFNLLFIGNIRAWVWTKNAETRRKVAIVYLFSEHVPGPGGLGPASLQFELQFQAFLLPVYGLAIGPVTGTRSLPGPLRQESRARRGRPGFARQFAQSGERIEDLTESPRT